MVLSTWRVAAVFGGWGTSCPQQDVPVAKPREVKSSYSSFVGFATNNEGMVGGYNRFGG